MGKKRRLIIAAGCHKAQRKLESLNKPKWTRPIVIELAYGRRRRRQIGRVVKNPKRILVPRNPDFQLRQRIEHIDE